MAELHTQVTAVVSLNDSVNLLRKELDADFLVNQPSLFSSVELHERSRTGEHARDRSLLPSKQLQVGWGHLFQTLENFLGFQRLIDDHAWRRILA